MATLEGQALSTILQMAQKPIIAVSEKYIIIDINHCAENTLSIKKNQIVGTSLTRHCSIEELNKLAYSNLEQITLLIKKEKYSCYALIVSEELSKTKTKTDFSELKHLQKHHSSNSNYSTDNFHYLESIISEIPVSVYWMNRDYVYLGCSNSMAKLLNLPSRHDIVGKTYEDLYDKKSADFYKQSDKSVMEHGISLSLEEPLYQPDGTKLVYLSEKVPLHDGKGTIMGMLGISTNITERKRMESDLQAAKSLAEAANIAKSEFLANMRHDIRTPLTGIVGFSEIIKMEAVNPKVKDYSDNLVASSHALLNLMDEVLEAVRVSSGEIPRFKKKFNVEETLQQVIDLNLPKAQVKGLALSLDIDPALPRFLLGDKIRLHRIALELIGNALNFTDAGEINVKLSFAKQEGRELVLKLVVTDTGMGIPKEKQEDIYLQFKRLTPSYEGIYKGAGLGLYVVKQFINELDGEIYVQSTPKQGTTFTCLIPFQTSLLDDETGVDDHEDSAIEETYLQPLESTLKPKSKALQEKPSKEGSTYQVLVVEDNAIAQKVAESILLSLNCRVDIAAEGLDALEKARLKTYDLIFMDIGLGEGMDGYAVTHSLRKQEKENTHVPIIALTAHGSDENKQRAIEAGMDAVMVKPLTHVQAKDLLNAFLQPTEEKKTMPAKTSDLPDMEWELFELDQYPLFDVESALLTFGDEASLADILKPFLEEELPKDVNAMEEAFKNNNFDKVEQLAHKIKGGAVYLGTARLKMACQFIERYYKTGERKLFPKLYEQGLKVIEQTKNAVQDWLQTQ